MNALAFRVFRQAGDSPSVKAQADVIERAVDAVVKAMPAADKEAFTRASSSSVLIGVSAIPAHVPNPGVIELKTSHIEGASDPQLTRLVARELAGWLARNGKGIGAPEQEELMESWGFGEGAYPVAGVARVAAEMAKSL